MTVVAIETTISLGAVCLYQGCAGLAFRMRNQLDTPKYTHGVSLMAVPETRGAWEDDHRTARKRAWRAERLGYRFDVIDRSRFNDDIYRINTSVGHRQGRPMSDGYTTRHNHGRLPEYPCERHCIHTFGVLRGDRLYAYLTLYRVGELALVSMILGHWNHLRDDIMYLLAAGTIEAQAGQGGWFYYNRHDSGTDGLRYYKERVGFAPADIAWAL